VLHADGLSEISVEAMVEEDDLWLAMLVLAHKQVAWVRVGMQPSKCEDHVAKHTDDNVGHVDRVQPLLLDRFDVVYFDALFVNKTDC